MYPAYLTEHAVIKPSWTPIVQLSSVIKHNELTLKLGQLNKIKRSIVEWATIEQNWMFDYWTVILNQRCDYPVCLFVFVFVFLRFSINHVQ